MGKEALKILHQQDLTEKVCVVVGTRPGIIKMSPLVKELARQKLPYFLIHTGQHYSYRMDRRIFLDLGLPEPRHHLKRARVGSLHGEQTAQMLKGIEAALIQEKPRTVLVCGDANTNLAGALAARKLNITVGHVESGLRSHDWRMPEEHNRVIIDHISEYLFAPTAEAKSNLLKDDVKGQIFVTGNTVVDALQDHLGLAAAKAKTLKKLKLNGRPYLLLTCHREENVDHQENLANIVRSLQLLNDKVRMPVVFPIHPRTKKRLEFFNLIPELSRISHLIPLEPQGYLEFLQLLAQCALVLTDSGGIQEESCILKVPCVTLRENTERPETLQVGSNVIAGTEPERVVAAVQQSLAKTRQWSNPFGDGLASARIIGAISGAPLPDWQPLSR